MADISDITSYLAGATKAAVYPNGTSQPSVAAMDVRIFEGWPLPDQLDLDVAGQMLQNSVKVPRPGGPVSEVSVMPMLGNSAVPYQILDDTLVISQPTYGLVIIPTASGFTVGGTPAAGEYLTVIADRTYVYSTTGVSAAAIIATLAASFAANYPDVAHTASSLTLPSAFAITVRQGGQGVLGRVTHRQKQAVMITVWSPNHRARSLLAAAIDGALKLKLVVTMPDTSQVLFVYNRTNTIDDQQMATIYRRDLIYDVEYATVFQFPGFVITSMDISIANYNNTAIAPAII